MNYIAYYMVISMVGKIEQGKGSGWRSVNTSPKSYAATKTNLYEYIYYKGLTGGPKCTLRWTHWYPCQTPFGAPPTPPNSSTPHSPTPVLDPLSVTQSLTIDCLLPQGGVDLV